MGQKGAKMHNEGSLDTWTPDGESIVEHVADIEDYQPASVSTFVLVLPEIAEPLGRKFAISNRMLDVLVAEIVLQRPRIHTLIGQLEPS
jgi:hypothetical protein